jgi:hypothetical protein
MKSLAFLSPKQQHQQQQHGSSWSPAAFAHVKEQDRVSGGAGEWFGHNKRRRRRRRQKQDSSSTLDTIFCALDDMSILKIKTQKASLQATYWTDVAIAADAREQRQRRRAAVVGFDKVDILYMDTALDRNPAVSEGPPIALGWKNIDSECDVDVDEYESSKSTLPPKTRAQMKLNCEEREQILLRTGVVTRRDIDDVMEQVSYDKWHREVIRRSAPEKDKKRYKV